MKISHVLSIRQFLVTLFFFLSLSFSYLTHANWERINPGGGGAFNSVAIGPTGVVVATSDLGGAYISEDDGNSWDSIGDLSHGLLMKHVQSVAFHPSDENIILLTGESTGSGNTGESTGISRSTDKGQSFVPATFVNGPAATIVPYQSTVVKSVAFAPSNGNIVYATARSNHDQVDSHIYKSTDAGLTFSLGADLTNTIDKPAIIKLAVHPTDPNTIIALSENDRFSNGQADNALLLSTNGGTSWTQVATNLNDMIDVVFHPTPDSNSINPVYISTYNPSNAVITGHTGKTYYCADIESNPNSCAEIHSQDDHRGFLWPIAGNDQQIRSIDSSFSWYWIDGTHPVAWKLTYNGSSWVDEVLAYNRDYTGSTAESWRAGWSRTHTVFGTIIGGETAKTLGYDLTYTNNDTIYWVTIQFAFKGTYSDSGTPTLDFLPAYTTENTSISDQWKSTGIDNITATLIDANDTDPDTLYIGLQDIGCWVSQDAGAFWKSCNFFHDYLNPLPGDWRGIDFSSGTNEYDVAFGGNVYALLSDPADPSNVWMSSSPSQKGDQALTYSSDYGQNWIIAANTPTGSSEVYGFSLDPTDTSHETLLVTIAGNIHRTTDGKKTSGATWSQISSPCSGGCRATAIDLNGSYYAGGEAGLFYSTNDGSNWAQFSGPINGAFSSTGSFHGANWQGVTNIRPDETTTGVVFVSVFKSKDNNTDYKSGVYRCDMNLSTPACTQLLGASGSGMGATPFIRDVAVDPSNSNILYASSSSAYTGPSYSSAAKGIYHSIDGGATWSLENDGMSWSSAFPLAISSADPDMVYTGSIGPGYYKRDFAASTVANYQDDFQGPTPTSGWSYFWNENGAIGNASNYTSLLWNGYHYDSDGVSGTDSSEFSYGRLKADGAHPGQGTSQGAAYDRYAIAAYQVSQNGSYSITNSSVNIDCSYSNGLDLRVYVNDSLISSVAVSQVGSTSFDMALGSLQSNDTIYVAMGPNGADGCDGVGLDYSIEYTNSAPIVIDPGTQTSGIGSSVSLQISATDDDGDTLTYSTSGLPDGLSINSSTGLISGSPTTLGSYNVTIIVSDGNYNPSISFTWDITQSTSSTVASYQSDFQGPTPASGWSYLWNENGAIGNASNYTSLLWNGYHYDSDGVSGTDSSEFSYGRLKADGAHPGQGTSQGAAYDRYAIAAYQVSQNGSYSITNSSVNIDCSYSNGLDLRVYVNDSLISSVAVSQVGSTSFDMALGSLQSNDTIYVAMGPNGADGCDGVGLDYSIEFSQPETVASYQSDFQGPTPASGWSYLWNENGAIGNASNYTSLLWNGYHYDSDGVSGTDSSEFSYGRLKADGAHPGQGTSQGAAYDRYAIAAYQVGQNGSYSITNSSVNIDCSYSNGLDLRVYVNDSLISSVAVSQVGSTSFDMALGSLQSNDTIYVAMGPNGADGCDGSGLDFSIEK